MTQTTERIYELIGAPRLWETEHDVAERRAVAQTIAAEIDALKAEVERLRPAAEAWEAQENSASIFMRYLRGHAPYEDTITAEGNAKAARARAAKARRERDAARARAAKGTP